MKVVRHLVVAAALGAGFVSCAEAHVFVGVGFSAPAVAVLPVAPVVPAVPVYAPQPLYYAPPAPVYSAPVVVGYYGHPQWHPHYYGGWHSGYAYGYWRR